MNMATSTRLSVHLLVYPASRSSHDAHQVLHAEGKGGKSVRLRDRNIDDLVRFHGLRV